MTTSLRRGNAPEPKTPTLRTQPGVAAAGVLGVIAIALAVATAELLAALGELAGWLHTTSSPLTSLGAAFIQLTPEWLKDWAIQTFGESDKEALKVGMGLTLVLAALAIGVLARRHLTLAVLVNVALLGVVAAAILTRAGSGVVDLSPTAAGGALGVWFLVRAYRPAGQQDGRGSASSSLTTSSPAEPSHADLEPDDRDWLDLDQKIARSGADHPMHGSSSTGGSTPLTGGQVTDRSTGGVDRRRFFRLAALGAAAAAVAGVVTRLLPSTAQVVASRAGVALPRPSDVQEVGDVALRVDGISPFVTPNAEFYRIDTAFTVPRLTAEDWQLRIHGLVDREVTLRWGDLAQFESVERMITLTCVSNEVGGDLAGNARWQGVRMADVLALAGVQSGADAVLSTSVDGMTIGTPLAALTDGRDALLAVAMNGEPLPVEHGFPARMVVPGLYGYVSATKWVVDLEVTRFEEISAYWTDRGWAEQAVIKTSSRIDVPKSFDAFPAGQVAVAGVAWAQHRGITAVQVQVDEGEWQEATLSEPVSDDTWRQWLYRWDATPGRHVIRCRAVDGAGEIQTSDVQGVMPDGSTGLDSRSVTVT